MLFSEVGLGHEFDTPVRGSRLASGRCRIGGGFAVGRKLLVNGHTFAGWCVIVRFPNGRKVLMFDPVVTTKAHLALFFFQELELIQTTQLR